MARPRALHEIDPRGRLAACRVERSFSRIYNGAATRMRHAGGQAVEPTHTVSRNLRLLDGRFEGGEFAAQLV